LNNQQVFFVMFGLSICVYSFFARWHVVPRLAKLPRTVALTALLWPHAIRHLGLGTLAPALVSPAFPQDVAQQIAYGDLLAMLLAFAAIAALRAEASFAIGLVWVANVVGSLDLLNALARATLLEPVNYDQIGAFWFIPTMWVPVLLVTHYLIFSRLVRGTRVAPQPVVGRP
jgi:hypothetical protein